MSRQNIRNFSPGYGIVQFIAAIYHKLYYRRFKLVNPENIPEKSPVIFALNHQNALMDALAIVFANRRQPVFMARADIFRKKWVASILFFLKILPVYRIRDGFHSVDQNKDVFKEVIRVLEFNRPVGILPEGNHFGEKRLRPLRKGAGKLALLAEEVNDFKLGLAIVPVGLDYSNYYNAGSDLLVIFGKPIMMADYREQYLQNPVQAINQLRDDLALAMKKVMIDISSEEYYKTIFSAIELFGPVELKNRKLKNSLLNKFKVKKELSEILIARLPDNEEAFKDLKTGVESYEHRINKFGLKDRLIANGFINPASCIFASLFTLFLLPIHLYGMVLNYLPYRLPSYFARKIKDKHLLVSVRFGIGLLLFFFWYLVLITTSLFIINSIFLNLAFIISLPLTGLFSFYYYIHLLRLRGKFRLLRLKIRNKEEYQGLFRERKEIISKIEKMLGK